jgi:hypothetical protein
MRQYKMEKEVADSVYDAIMETLNPTLSLTDREVQIELNRIAEQTKTKIAARPLDTADFSIIKQVAQELNRLMFPPADYFSDRGRALRNEGNGPLARGGLQTEYVE